MTDVLAELHRRQDGPPPRPARLAALRGGAWPRDRLRARGALVLAERLASEARDALARRRRATPRPEADARLDRLGRDLAGHRVAALRLRERTGHPRPVPRAGAIPEA